MADEHTQQPLSRGRSRRERVEFARSRDILDVANELHMELVQSGRDYRWKEHDSLVITPDKNVWKWFSRNQGGDVISLVEVMREVNFNQAIDYLNDGSFKEFTAVERVQDPFSYYLKPYEQPFEAAKSYLRDLRGLSDETIDFFLDKGVLAQANAKVNGSIEPVVVFKALDFSGEIVGATLQGIEENWEKWPERGYAKNIVRNSDGITGMHVDIGQPNRLIFAESAIDLMSYYELHKDNLQDVRLISMDGLKEAVVSRHLAQLQSEVSGKPLRWSHDQLAEGLQTAIEKNFFTEGKHADWITLAVDNDEGGRTFIDSLQKKGAAIISDLPELQAGQEKTDWNDYLQQVKKGAEKELVFTMDRDAIQEALSQEGDLVGSQISENQMVYTNRIDIGQDYQLSLTIYSPEAVDQLSDVAAHWTVEVLKDNQSLGYLAYGGDWGNEFHITEELKGLQEGIQSHQLERQLYTQKEIDGFLKQYDDVSKPDNSRLAQARRKLERLQNEGSSAIDAVYEYGAQTNGQPMNDKRGGDRYFRRQEQLENRIFSKLDEVKKQKERVERLEHQQHLKELGLNRQGTGLEMSVQNIPRIREELEKADRGESFYTRETLKRYRSELERLEGIVDQVSSVTISPAAQSLIDDGLVTQWAKQPNIYFVKGLRRVAFELTDSGEFQPSKKYSPRTPEEVNKVEELLSRKMTPELSQKPQLEVIFDFSENRRIAEKYNQGDIIPYQEFVSDLYQENSLATFDLGYFKTYFALQNEHGEILVESFRYDIGTEKELLSEQLSQALPAEYLQKAYDADLQASGKKQEFPHNQEELSSSQMKTYDEVKRENEELVKRLENRIKDGDLAISFDTDVYLYDVFSKLGNSHPFKYLNDKRLEVLTPLQPMLASIDEKTIDLYKNKGTMEQDALYQALAPHQRTLGVDISTRFIGELAIAAYSTNKQLDSLTADHFGSHYGNRTLDNLSQSIERMLEYPLNESGAKDYTYGFVTTPNAFYHYLEEQEGEVVLGRAELDTLLSRLKEKQLQIVEPIQEEVVAVSEAKEKSPEITQETISVLGQQKNAEGTIGDFPDNHQEAAPLPEANQSQPLNDLSPNQTQPQPLLYFSINKDGQSINKRNYHAISDKDLVKLNRYAGTLQQAANWYLNELADSKIYYFYQENDSIQTLQVTFDKDKFQHLTGVFPYREGQSAEKTLEDFANGNGAFDTILLANKGAAFDKLKVLPELPAIVESDSFYFDDLSEVPKLHSLDLDKAIKSGDEDIILALRTVDNTTFPASLMKLRTGLNSQLVQFSEEKTILGVYREREGILAQLSINEEYVKDGGEELFSILKNKQYQEVSPEENLTTEGVGVVTEESEITPEAFTQVLDAVYNVGAPQDLSNVPEEFHAAWNRYFELSEATQGDFKQVINQAAQDNLLVTSSSFYQEWAQDRIYNENYHVRLQWAEKWPNGAQLPYEDGDVIDYQDFVTSLYKGNREFYNVIKDSVKQAEGTGEGYIPYTKVKFDIYAPGGQLIKDNVRYDIGDETEPVSRLLGLGYRRLEGQPELARIDDLVLSQLENQELNHEIALEANEQVVSLPEIPEESLSERTTFSSPKQEMKVNLAQRLEELEAEEAAKKAKKEVSSQVSQPDAEFDYKTASAYEISERAFQKVREYTQSPEALAKYMDFMSKFPQLSPRNVALIQEQWRGANAVATYDQWQAMGDALGITADDVIQTKKVFTNKRTGETKEVVHQGLSVKTGEKAQITLFRPLMTKMIPVLDAQGNQLKNDKGNPKYKKLSEATPQEKALLKEGKIKVTQFQERDLNTGQPRFTTYKVFELSQTTLKPESYPKAMPNRHFDFNTDKVKTKEVLEGLCDYAKSIGVTIMQDDAHVLGNAKGAFYPGEQLILLNPENTPGEKIATTIHELAHATLHNPSLTASYQENLPKSQKELEAEMTSHLVSKHFGLDTSEKAIDYMAKWTENLTKLDDKELAHSFKRIHKTVSQVVKHVETHTKPYQAGRQRGMQPNFPKAPTKGLSR